MSKKAIKAKEKPIISTWVYSPTVTGKNKMLITQQFEGLIDTLKSKILPGSVDNYCIDIYSEWQQNFFYIMKKNKGGADKGLARLEFHGEDRYHLAHQYQTDSWLTIHKDISFENVQKAILDEVYFKIV